MTGSEFLTYVKEIFKRTDKDDEIYQATTDIVADMRLRMLTQEFSEEATITGITTLGQYRVGLPSDFGHIIGDIGVIDTATDQDYPPMKKISKTKYDRLAQDRTLSTFGNINTDVPTHFCIYAEQIYLYPVPDKITYQFSINYTTESFTEVDASTDPVPFTDQYRRILRHGVLSEMYSNQENYQEGEQWERRYEQGVGKIIANDDFNTDDDESMVYKGV